MSNEQPNPKPASPKPKVSVIPDTVMQPPVTVVSPTDLALIKIYKPHIESYKLKMLVYGPPGVGKTSLLATAGLHKMTSPILLINIEGGMLSVAESGTLGLKEVPDVVDLNSFGDLDSIFWYLAKGDHPYKSVGIDSLSELQLVNLEHIVKGLVGKSSSSGARRESLDDIWRDDYGTSTQQLRRIVRRFRDLPMHVLFSCHDSSSQDKDKNETVHPMLTPKLRTAVMGYMDIICYMFIEMEADDNNGIETSVRKLLCRPYGKWIAKDRSPGQKLGLTINNPTMPIIIDRILSKGAKI